MGEGAKIFRLAGTVKYSSSHGIALLAVGVSCGQGALAARCPPLEWAVAKARWRRAARRWSGPPSRQQGGGTTPVLPPILQYEKGTGSPVPFAVDVEPCLDVEPRRAY